MSCLLCSVVAIVLHVHQTNNFGQPNRWLTLQTAVGGDASLDSGKPEQAKLLGDLSPDSVVASDEQLLQLSSAPTSQVSSTSTHTWHDHIIITRCGSSLIARGLICRPYKHDCVCCQHAEHEIRMEQATCVLLHPSVPLLMSHTTSQGTLPRIRDASS